MPGLGELEQLSKSYSLAIALLAIGGIWLAISVVRLYCENQRLWNLMKTLLEKRVEVLETIVGRIDVR